MPVNIHELKLVLDFEGIVIAFGLMVAAVLLFNLLTALRFRTKIAEYRNISKLEHRQLERLNEIVVEERNCLDHELTKARVVAEAQQTRHQEDMAAAKAECQKAHTALADSQREKKTLSARIGQLEQEVAGVRQELEMVRRAGATAVQRELEERVGSLSAQLASGNEELDKERCIVFELHRRICDLERANAELKQENTLLVATVTRPPERFPARFSEASMDSMLQP